MTGASGFIGRRLLADLNGRGIEVQALVRGGRQLGHAIAIPGDVRDEMSLRELVRGCEVVVHLAAFVHHGTMTEEDAEECRSVNVDGTARLVRAIADEGSKPFLVFISSANVYPPGVPADEETPPQPSTLYGETKWRAEGLVLDAIRRGEIEGTVLRPAMVFGEGAPGNLARLIAMVRRRVVLDVNGGSQKKTIVPVANVISAIHAVVSNREASSGRIYNVGGAVLSMRELTELIARAAGVHPLHVPVPGGLARRVARVADRVLRPSVSFERLALTYMTDAIILDDRIRRLPEFTCADVPAEIARTVLASGRRASG